MASVSAGHSASAGKNEKISQGHVDFKNGPDAVKGYLAHPVMGKAGPAVLVLHGNPGVSDDIRHTAVRLAEAGFVGLAVSSTSRENDDLSRLPQEFVMSDRFINRYISDAQAGIEFLKGKTFYDGEKGFGVLGYCGGGYTAARFALEDQRVKAIVVFYGSPGFPPERNSPTDPRPPMLEFVEKVKIPMQFHYGTRDGLIPNEQVQKLRERITENRLKADVFIYNEAQHGFANKFGQTYREDHAALAEKRWRKFFKNELK